MTLASYARELAENFRGAQVSSVSEMRHNKARAVGLDLIAIRLETQEERNGSIQTR